MSCHWSVSVSVSGCPHHVLYKQTKQASAVRLSSALLRRNNSIANEEIVLVVHNAHSYELRATSHPTNAPRSRARLKTAIANGH